VSFQGSAFQNAIYASGESAWPIGAEQWEALAAAVLEPGPFDYIAGGAGSEATMRANREAFERRRLRPRMLRGNVDRDLSVEVLGARSPAPFFLAPIGVLSIAHGDGELAVARAAAATGIPMVLSSAASHSLEEVAAAMGDAPRWFQLYWVNDREIALSFVERAGAGGFGAIVVTLDTLTLGWRPRDLQKPYLPFITGEGCAQFFSDPVFRSRLARPPEEDLAAAAVTMLGTFPNLGLTWDDLAWLRGETDLPLLVKGVLTGEDAVRARDAGVDGVVVSNHGGRQVDGAVAAALGANAVLLGRPYVYGLAVGGQEGVETVIHQLMAETDLTLALTGGTVARDLDASWIAAPS
jgi:lactate 2-monooxygenase